MADLKELETERLRLRPTGVNDAPFILELLNTPKWLQFIGDRGVKTHQQAVGYIEEKMLPQLEKLGFSNNTVILKASGEKIGVCGLYEREGQQGFDIGFAFLPAYEKKGYALEAASELLKAAKEVLGMKYIKAITAKDNVDSQRLLQKLGFSFTRTTTLPGENEEVMLYEVLW